MSSDLFPAFMKSLEAMSVTPHERILVAVSGGPDSMALLHLFWRWNGRRIGVFHLNHGFRANASKDATFVEDYSIEHGIPAQIEAYDINRYLSESGESKQQGARKVRYQLLKHYAETNGYHRIALGHHGDDQAETVLMRILRGAGLHGLGGIPPQRGPFIRPLLNTYKTEILQYCEDFDVPYVLDESNFEPVYFRNDIRQELIPLLSEKYNPEIMVQLVQLAELAREDELELQTRAGQVCQKHLKWKRGQVLFPRSVFGGLSIAMQRRVLRTLLQTYRGNLLQIGFSHIEDWRMQLAQSSSFRLSLPQVWVSANADFIFVGDFVEKKWKPVVLDLQGQVEAGHFTLRAEVLTKGALEPRPANSEDFDLDSLNLPLMVRTRQDGDRIKPFGGSGSKKVKDILIDARIPAEQRDSLPLICDQEEILWIPTVRRSSRGALSDSTGKVLRLSFFAQ